MDEGTAFTKKKKVKDQDTVPVAQKYDDGREVERRRKGRRRKKADFKKPYREAKQSPAKDAFVPGAKVVSHPKRSASEIWQTKDWPPR